MATWDGDGNNLPIAALADAVTARGDEVVVLGHGTTRARFERVGCTFVEWASASQPRNTRDMPPAEELAYVMEHVVYCTSYQADLRPVIEELAPDVVLVDVSLKYALLECLRAETPLQVLCHVAYALVAGNGAVGNPRFEELTRAATRDGVPAFSSDRAMMDMADGVVVFCHEGFDPLHGGDAGPNVLHVGSLRATSAMPSGWQRRSPDKRLVLVSLSTGDMNQAPLLQRLCDACGQLDVEALVTTGPSLPSGTLTSAANVMVVDFIDHDEVLPHADLVVTHAGLGSVTAALAHGVPMLCTPLGRDQGFNAGRVAELGLGMTLDPGASTDELREAIRIMLDNREAKRRAAEFEESLSAHPGIEDALRAIDRSITTR